VTVLLPLGRPPPGAAPSGWLLAAPAVLWPRPPPSPAPAFLPRPRLLLRHPPPHHPPRVSPGLQPPSRSGPVRRPGTPPFLPPSATPVSARPSAAVGGDQSLRPRRPGRRTAAQWSGVAWRCWAPLVMPRACVTSAVRTFSLMCPRRWLRAWAWRAVNGATARPKRRQRIWALRLWWPTSPPVGRTPDGGSGPPRPPRARPRILPPPCLETRRQTVRCPSAPRGSCSCRTLLRGSARGVPFWPPCRPPLTGGRHSLPPPPAHSPPYPPPYAVRGGCSERTPWPGRSETPSSLSRGFGCFYFRPCCCITLPRVRRPRPRR